jgi:MYXO-CTERM domain-containing protein
MMTSRPGAHHRTLAPSLLQRLRPAMLAAAALLGIAMPGRAQAVTENYCSFPASLATWTYNGNAFEALNSEIRLTTAVPNEAGSAFLTTPIALAATTSLHAHFRFQMGPSATGGDGVAFVLQNSAAGAAALGGTVNNLGYSGITPSVAIKFDTYNNGATDHGANYVAIMLNGSTALPAAGWWATPSFTMAGAGVLNTWVDYTPGTISVYLSQTATKPGTPLLSHALTLTTQIGAQAYVGFTSSTGPTPEINEHDILELELSTVGIPCSCEGDPACSGATPACDAAGICAICSATNHTACTGATPVCDVPVNSCVGCLTNANCSGGTPICDSGTLTCRACTGNPDCGGATPECDTTAGSANLGRCVACVADANCPPATPRCNLATNACTQCLSATDCGGNTPVCNGGVCKACASDANCGGATPACEVWGACGQCTSTNGTACTGGTAVCDFPTGTCVGCEFNTDCSGSTPVCNTTTHTCGACQTNADCTGSPSGPACATSGMKAGSCVGCLVKSDCTSATTPQCDTISNLCVACLTSADCSAPSPVCNASNLCVGCATNADCSATAPICNAASSTCTSCQNDYSASNPGPNSCPSATLPACQPTGAPLVGECGQCSSLNNSACAAAMATPVCNTTTATCGCVKDTDCKPGSYCDTMTVATGTCTAGCRVVNGMNNCATGEYCTATNGSVGTCKTEPCNGPADCKAPTPICDTINQPYMCVQCINNSDCTGKQVCDATNHCAVCTAQQTQNCSAATTGAACLGSETCGCLKDGDCGSPTSGRVCNMATSACEVGCRGTGGNGCTPPQVCSSTTSAIGTCGAAPPGGMDAGSQDAGSDDGSMSDASAPSGKSGGGSSSGCGCRVAGSSEQARFALGGLLVGLAVLRRRRSQRSAG